MAEAASESGWTRRAAMAGGLVAAGGALAAPLAGAPAAAAAAAAQTKAMPMPATPAAPDARYFNRLAAALGKAGIGHPVLVIDRQLLDRNIAAVNATLAPAGLPVRVVVKSLPVMPLIDLVAKGVDSDRFMVFNGAMVEQMAPRPSADLLLGKPLPVAELQACLGRIGPDAAGRVQWLIDTPQRLRQYAGVLHAANAKLRANIEIDVGLHRGGCADAASLAQLLELARSLPDVEISGVMGYDAHVPGAPDVDLAFAVSQVRYRALLPVLRERLQADPATLTLNGAGSPTYALHARGTAANEVSIGSAFVKPADFDRPTLAHHVAASFIATPVLKAGPMQVPGQDAAAVAAMVAQDPALAQSFFIYGGHWLATPVSPPGLRFSRIYGRSSNQEQLTGPASIDLKPDDLVFFRPDQSEAVLLRFGAIAVFDGAAITGFWEPFPISA